MCVESAILARLNIRLTKTGTMKNKFLLVWSFLIAFSVTAFAQNDPKKGEVPEVPDVFEQLEEVVVTAGGIAREKKHSASALKK